VASAIKEALIYLEWEVLHPAYFADVAPMHVTRRGRCALHQPQEIPRMSRSLDRLKRDVLIQQDI
jgi:hypothetical protein